MINGILRNLLCFFRNFFGFFLLLYNWFRWFEWFWRN